MSTPTAPSPSPNPSAPDSSTPPTSSYRPPATPCQPPPPSTEPPKTGPRGPGRNRPHLAAVDTRPSRPWLRLHPGLPGHSAASHLNDRREAGPLLRWQDEQYKLHGRRDGRWNGDDQPRNTDQSTVEGDGQLAQLRRRGRVDKRHPITGKVGFAPHRHRGC